MKFETALAALREGKLVKRENWDSIALAIRKSHTDAEKKFIVAIAKFSSVMTIWDLTQEDILAEDWMETQ